MTDPQSILVVRLTALGDIVLSLPTVDALRERFPRAHLAFLARDPEGRILEGVRTIDRLILWAGSGAPLPPEVQGRRWDLLVDLSATGRSHRLLARVSAERVLRAKKESWRRWVFVRLRGLGGARVHISSAMDRMAAALEPLGIERGGRVPRLSADRARLGALSDDHSGRGRVLLAPGGGRETKRWPAKRYAEVARAIGEQGATILVLGSRDEESILREIAVGAGGTYVEVVAGADPADLPAMVSSCDVAITNDSGLLHVAEACGVPVIALFGPTHPRLGFAPWRAQSIALRVEIECSPCDLHGPLLCPLGHHRCMQDLSVERVRGALFERLPAASGRTQRPAESRS